MHSSAIISAQAMNSENEKTFHRERESNSRDSERPLVRKHSLCLAYTALPGIPHSCLLPFLGKLKSYLHLSVLRTPHSQTIHCSASLSELWEYSDPPHHPHSLPQCKSFSNLNCSATLFWFQAIAQTRVSITFICYMFRLFVLIWL